MAERQRTGGRSDEVRRRVGEACLTLLGQGRTDLSPAEVATLAGVTRATVYRWWPTKVDLLREALVVHTARRIDPPDTGSWHGDLHELGRRLARFFSDPVEVAQNRIMASGDAPDYDALVYECYQPIVASWRAMVERSMVRGELRAGIDPDTVLGALTAPLIATPLLFHRPPTDAEVDALVELLHAGTISPSAAPTPQPVPGVLTREMQRMVAEQRLAFVATVRADGAPSVSPKGTTIVVDDAHLLFADVASPGTVANLAHDPRVELDVVDPIARRGFRFRGTATVHTDDAEFERGLGLLAAAGSSITRERIRSIVVVHVEEASAVWSPAYDVGATEADVVARWLEHHTALHRPVPSADRAVRLGVADHLGWAVVVAVSADGHVVDRRRIELVESGLPVAPVHHEGGAHEMHRTGDALSDDALADLVERVRGSAARTIDHELARLADDLGASVASLSLRVWPDRFPSAIADQRRPPHESRADAVMYRRELAAAATRLGWRVETFDARTVEREAVQILAPGDDEVLQRPRAELGAPWTKDHRTAYAAAVVAGIAHGG